MQEMTYLQQKRWVVVEEFAKLQYVVFLGCNEIKRYVAECGSFPAGFR